MWALGQEQVSGSQLALLPTLLHAVLELWVGRLCSLQPSQSLSPGKDWGDLRPAGTLGEKETLPSGLWARPLPGRQRL